MRHGAIFLLLFSLSTPGAAQELGRLFFTPEQRAALDARRQARVPDKPAAQAVGSPTTRLDGYVKRSGGPSTVFVNGEAVLEGSVSVGEGSARRELRPGEVFDRGTGEVRDVIGEGRLRVPAGERQ
jgi:hypothetical protein